MKKKVLIRCITTIFSISVFVAVILTVLFRNYVSKASNFLKYEGGQKETVYILGTFHNSHFDKKYHYSMADIQNCIANVKPDVVYIEAREAVFKKYGCVDGPIDTLLAYSYCKDHNIPVRLIDWWKVDNNFKTNQGATNETRDDAIFKKIKEGLEVDSNKTILIVYGATHRTEQMDRFAKAGYKETVNFSKDKLFRSKGKFRYPESMKEVVTDKIEYLKNDFNKEVKENVTDPDVASFAKENKDALIKSLQGDLNNYINKNKLY